MLGKKDSSDDVHTDPPPSGTHAGADATARMTGTHTSDPYPENDVRTVHGTDTTDTTHGRHVADGAAVHEDRGRKILPAKTSAAAAFALVFGVTALFSALTAILAPVAVLLGLIGIVLGVVALKMVKRPGVTGKGVAIGGLVTAVLGLLLGAAVIGGAAVVVNDDAQLDQIQERIDDLRADLPTIEQIQDEVPG